jgi:hypothetical protein
LYGVGLEAFESRLAGGVRFRIQIEVPQLEYWWFAKERENLLVFVSR